MTIDDNEGHYLKVLMDEVFGRASFVSAVIWQKIYAVKNSARHFSDMHDYIWVYARNAAAWTRNLLPRSTDLDATYSNPDGDPRGAWTTNALQARNFYGQGTYELEGPTGRKFNPPTGTYWRVSHSTFSELNRDGRIWWGRHRDSVPRIKKFLAEAKQGVVPATLWSHTDAGQNAEAKQEIRDLFGGTAEIFLTPKPERLAKRILEVATAVGDVVLDSYLGSGTTAAVAHKMNRRWIGIEMGEHARTHCLPRLQKVFEGEQGGVSKAVGWQGGGGFRFLRLGEPIFNADGHIHPSVRFATLASFIWMQETSTAGHGPWNSPKLGVHDGRAIYLLFNGILRDLRAESGNVLTGAVLAAIERVLPHDGPKVVYGEACRLGAARLAAAGITFKQLPYDVQAR